MTLEHRHEQSLRPNEGTREEAQARAYADEILGLFEGGSGHWSEYAILQHFSIEQRFSVLQALSTMVRKENLERTEETMLIEGREYPIYKLPEKFTPPAGFAKQMLGEK